MGLFSKKKTDNALSVGGDSVILSNGENIKIDQMIDCLGDSCPRPQLMTKSKMSSVESGTIVEVRIDNPTSVEAIPPMMKELASKHIETVRDTRYWRVILIKE
jgi:tRNA 2-thiouridine synthesizing protein A